MQLVLDTPLFCIVTKSGNRLLNTLSYSREYLEGQIKDRLADEHGSDGEHVAPVFLNVQHLSDTAQPTCYFTPVCKL
jgi:hypothetical protein